MSDQVERFRRQIESLVAAGRPFAATVESAGVMQVERSADVLTGRLAAAPVPAMVMDAAGHRRPVYRALLAYAAGATDTSVQPVEFTAANGSQAAAATWWALANDDAAAVQRIVEQQRPSGAFLRATSSDNPEVHWYHELVVLHAMADHAVRTGDPATVAAVGRACAFHLEETETDHATGQPWGLPAFVRVTGAEPLAGAVLHAVAAHQPGGPSGVALFLLADTLYGLARNSGGWGPARSED